MSEELCGQCSVCGPVNPGIAPPPPHEALVEIAAHAYPKSDLGQCIGSRMRTRRLDGDVQLNLFAGEAA